jgi:adenylate kinase family enzyme
LLPEAWATASVYSYAQMLRCLLGHFASEAAHGELRARRPDFRGVDDARKQLAARGDTFAPDNWTVGRRLASLFVHPRSAPDVDAEIVNPDAAPIDESDARSAILFGPPGTGKTTLAEALAGALGWQFVEVLASDFLVRGVDAVPAEADRIFAALMELDRCVVLFDEIDELIRKRDSSETDPFGRFLTTSMLPKIARLWKQRRIIFFVATNHVATADSAIRRASRFDATILVAPPSLHVKRRLLREMLGDDAPEFDDAAVHAALDGISDAEKDALPFGVLALLRYDQISDLARRLRDDKTEDRLPKALRELGEDLQRNEWRPPTKSKKEKETEESESVDPLVALFRVYREYREDGRLDGSRRGLFACDSEIRLNNGFQSVGNSADGLSLYVAPPNLASIAQPDGKATGEIYLPAEVEHKATVGDGCLLRFVPR